MKQLLQNLFSRFGYELHRKRPEFQPYIEQVMLGGATFQFWVSDALAKDWYIPEAHARIPEHLEISRLVCPGDRVLDIGAHHGFQAMLFSRIVGESGFVLCVEPSSSNAMIIAAQIGLNHATNCQVLQAAVNDYSGTVRISRESNAKVTRSIDSVEVQAFTVDELDSKFGPFNVLKIDVEGFEHQVLIGAKQVLERQPVILLELHSPPLATSAIDEILTILSHYRGTFMPRFEAWEKLYQFPEDEVPRNVIVNLFLSLHR